MTRLRSTRARSSWVAGLSYVPLAPELRAQHPGHGLLMVKLKAGGEHLYLIPSQWYATLCRRNVSPGAFLNRHCLRGKVPAEKVN
jgi:hypothetical protein